MLATQTNYRVFERPAELQPVVAKYYERGLPICFDTETTGLNPRRNRLISLQFKQIGFAPIIVDCRQWGKEEAEYLANLLVPLACGSRPSLWIGHNIGFDYEFLATHYGIWLSRMYDTMLAEKIIKGGISDEVRYGLGDVCERYHLECDKEERKWFYDLDQTPDWNKKLPASVIYYMGRDVEVLETLYHEQTALLQERNLTAVAKLEFACIKPIAKLEMKGIHVNKDAWRLFIAAKEVEALEAESQCIAAFGEAIASDRITKFDRVFGRWSEWNDALKEKEAWLKNHWENWDEAWDGDKPAWGAYKTKWMQAWRAEYPNPGRPSLPYKRDKGDTEVNYLRFSENINVGSPDQMKVAFKVLNIPLPRRRNEKGETVDSLREEDLTHLVDAYPIVAIYIRFKKKRKFVDSFGEKFLAHEESDGRIHTHINQIIATGRISSSDPNLQNIPSRGEDGHELRKNITAAPGYKLVTNDYAGIEDRIVCFLSGDPVKRRMYDEGLDTHTETAKLLFRCDGEDARTPRDAFGGQSYRDVAKTFGYATLYGAYAAKLSKRIHTEVAEAQRLLYQFRDVFSVTFKWLDAQQLAGRTNLVTRTILGRPRYASRGTKPTWEECQGGESYRQAIREYNGRANAIGRELANHEVQGTSADMTKQALVYLDDRLPAEVSIILAVHDEIVLEAPDELAEYASAILESSMADAAELFLPGFPNCCGMPTISIDWRH